MHPYFVGSFRFTVIRNYVQESFGETMRCHLIQQAAAASALSTAT